MHNVNDVLSYVKHSGEKVVPRNDMLARVDAFVQACKENKIVRLEEHGYTPEEFKANVQMLMKKSLCKNLAFGKPATVLTEWSEKYPVGGGKALTDGVFGEMNLIFCRNVLIYFNKELQNRVIGLFHDSLIRKGFLGLGSKESISFSNYKSSFETISDMDKIYQKK